MIGRETVFQSGKLSIPTNEMTPVPLGKSLTHSQLVINGTNEIVFTALTWFEVLMAVAWDTTNIKGTRFAHTKIPGQEPLHSEAINAEVLAQLSGGQQLLRGNTIFGLNNTKSLVLEVWQDSGESIDISAELRVRELT